MISLQIAFLIAGIVVFFVVVIISYDKVRHSRLHRRGDARFDTGIDDTEPEPLLTPRAGGHEAPRPAPSDGDEHRVRPIGQEAPRLKPEFLEEEPPGVAAPEPERREAAPNDAAGVEAPAGGVPEVPEHGPKHGEDEGVQIEYVARIPGNNVINRDSALGIYRQREFDLAKPHRIFGLSHPTRMWCDLEKQPESARFTDLGLTLQLADREGPADESELNRFSQLVLKLAEVFGRRFQFSCDLDQALQQAQYLDKMIKKYDALAILNIVARNDSFRMADIDDVAQDLGMIANQRKVYVKYENKHSLYRMVDKEKTRAEAPPPSATQTTRGVTLFMDIPRTPDPARIFTDMVSDAKEICKRLDGKLVDENHRGMTQKGLKRIGQEIRSMAAEMERDGITPGRECALKLF